VMINCIWHTALMVPYATNRHGRIALFYTPIYGVAAIGLGYIGTASIGITGASIGLLLTEATMAIIVIRASLRMSRLHIAKWWKMIVQIPYDLLGLSAANLIKRITAMPE
jgi:O-antigen/teichoic acid export membrane protein